jgi:hypothetical protein
LISANKNKEIKGKNVALKGELPKIPTYSQRKNTFSK